jgi:ABC-type Fe3+ transport system substrate-binding protein
MREKIILLLVIVAVVAVPLVLRQRGEIPPAHPDDVLVIITPDNEYIRDEFARAFRDYWRQKTGRTVAFDWRIPGGTSDITRLVNSQFANAFRNLWVNDLRQPWSEAVARGFTDAKLDAAAPNAAVASAAAARQAFLAGNIGIGLDIMFGGGPLDFAAQAARGQLVPSGVEQRHPEWFTDAVMPQEFSGQTLRDPQGRWQGAALSTFGLVFNRDRLRAAAFPGAPTAWSDLADPRFRGAVGLADPTQSASNAAAFEMMIQQQMQLRRAALRAQNVPAAEAEKRAVAEGWQAGMELAQLAAANSAYFTAAAPKPILDVAAGDCALGMAIDFYGRTEEETLALRNPDDPARANRFGFVMPRGGSSLSADPIALFRGAPHPEVARAFIDFVLSLDGQKLWDFRPGTPGGPKRWALRRSPIRRDLYAAPWLADMADPGVLPYEDAGDFVYHAAWTAPYFSELRFVIQAAFMDPHPELAEAWAAILRARRDGRAPDAAAALAKLQDLSAINYAAVTGSIQESLAAGPLTRLELEARLSGFFARQYRAAETLAEGGGAG